MSENIVLGRWWNGGRIPRGISALGYPCQLHQSFLCRDLHCVLVRLGNMMVPGHIEAWHGLGPVPRLGAGPEWLCWGCQAFELP